MKSVNVLFLWKVPDPLQRYLREQLKGIVNLNLLFPKEAEEAEMLSLAPRAQVIVGWRPSQELLDCANQLKLFIFPGAGVQHLLEWFREEGQARGAVLVNGHSNSYFVAQHIVALLLALLNKIIPHHRWMVNGRWRKGDADAKTIPFWNRKVGLLGYGAINKKVHKLLNGFKVEFAILRRNWKGKDESLPSPAKKYNPSQLHEFLASIDTLIVAVPLTTETTGIIGSEELKLLGQDGILVNVARGDVVDQKALYDALSQNTIAGAAIDVWYTYKPEPDEEGRKYPFEEPFHTLDNIILSPHRAASPFDDLNRWGEVIDNITRFAQERTDFINVVDLKRGY
jgi:phosphoglycerate dehydrogenase-like enzyme